ncbi:MAG TPA: ferredoxin reductase family protein, partial [Micromonosporaceae bacterium]|nr:ferredoxin reductase family protein [Micromonosporaceae bacterium]
MSRAPLIERASSGARRSRWHRDLGAYVLIMISLHIVLITLGYAGTTRTGIWAEIWRLLTSYQDMISAVIAFGIMVVISLTALRQIRRRLPYGIWHAVHACAYLILLLVYGHQLANGQQFVLSPVAHACWVAFYVLVAVAVVYGRIVVPALLNNRHRLRVDAVVPETTGVVSIYLTGSRLGELRATAGQYAHWRFLTPDGWWRAHPFSLSAAPNHGWLRLTVKATGDYSARLHRVAHGTRVWIDTPTGEFTAGHRVRGSAALIAVGSGIAPVRALMEALPAGTVVVYRARTRQDLIFESELDGLAATRGMTVHYVVGHRHEPGPAALLTFDGLAELVPDVVDRDVYLCGPDGWAAEMTDMLVDAGVDVRQVHADAFEL